MAFAPRVEVAPAPDAGEPACELKASKAGAIATSWSQVPRISPRSWGHLSARAIEPLRRAGWADRPLNGARTASRVGASARAVGPREGEGSQSQMRSHRGARGG